MILWMYRMMMSQPMMRRCPQPQPQPLACRPRPGQQCLWPGTRSLKVMRSTSQLRYRENHGFFLLQFILAGPVCLCQCLHGRRCRVICCRPLLRRLSHTCRRCRLLPVLLVLSSPPTRTSLPMCGIMMPQPTPVRSRLLSAVLPPIRRSPSTSSHLLSAALPPTRSSLLSAVLPQGLKEARPLQEATGRPSTEKKQMR